MRHKVDHKILFKTPLHSEKTSFSAKVTSDARNAVILDIKLLSHGLVLVADAGNRCVKLFSTLVRILLVYLDMFLYLVGRINQQHHYHLQQEHKNSDDSEVSRNNKKGTILNRALHYLKQHPYAPTIKQ